MPHRRGAYFPEPILACFAVIVIVTEGRRFVPPPNASAGGLIIHFCQEKLLPSFLLENIVLQLILHIAIVVYKKSRLNELRI